MSGKITRSVVNGATWTGFGQVTLQGLRFISVAILARILSPDDFGMVAMVTIVTSVAAHLIDMGFVEVVVQRKEITQKQLSTIYWIILSTGIALCLLVSAISPFIARFFNNEQVGPLLAVSSLIFVIHSSASLHSALLRKKLQFHKSSIADIGDAFGYVAGALPAAFAGLGVWSLVIGNITGYIPGTILRWIFARWHPSFVFSVSSLKDIWKFGAANVSTRMVYTVMDRLDYLIIGKFLSAATLGFYYMSLRIIRMPADSLTFIGNRISLPAFALVQDDTQRLQRGLLKGESFLSLIAIPLFTGLAIVAPELISVFVGAKWLPAVSSLRILCVAGCVSILNIGVPAMFLAKGRPDINLKLSLMQLVILVPALLIGVRFGPASVAIVISSVSLLVWLIRQLFVHRLIKLSFKEYLSSLRPAFFASLIMAAVLLSFRYLIMGMFDVPDIILLISEVLIGIAVYIAVLKLSNSRAVDEMFNLLLEMIKPYGKLIYVRVHSINKKAEKGKPFNDD